MYDSNNMGLRAMTTDEWRRHEEYTIDDLKAEIERLRAALEAIKTIKPLKPIGDYGDPYAELVVSCVAIAVNALAGRALEPKS